MASSVSNLYNSNRLRLSGMASGLDTDSIVKQMVSADQTKIDKVKQDRDLLEWKRDDYRTITNLLRGFNDEYFDILKPQTNMRSSSSYNKYTVTSSDDDVVTATGTTGVTSLTHKISDITMATAAAESSDSQVSVIKSGTDVADIVVGADGKTFNFSLQYNGVKKDISLNLSANTTYTAADIASLMDTQIEGLFKDGSGNNIVDVVNDNGKLKFTTSNVPANSENMLTITSADSNFLSSLGLEAGQSNRLSINNTMAQINNKLGGGAFTFGNVNINGTSIEIKAEDTLSTFLSKVNASNAGVTMSYSSLTDKFTITSKVTGADQTVKLNDNGTNFFSKLQITYPAEGVTGTNAKFTLDGVAGVERSTNTFSVDGVTYTLKQNTDGVTGLDQEYTLTLSQDTQTTYDNIKKFIDKYNEVLTTLNTKLSEKRDKSYLPLTADQRESMSDDDITKWEAKAKTGLLRNDSILSGVVSQLRRAFTDKVDSLDLASIGIETGSYETKGLIIIKDETKLKQAIQNNPEGVTNLFTKQSTTVSSYSADNTTTQRDTRYKENGIVYRVYDILQDYVRRSVDKSGNQGILLQQAGAVGSIHEYKNPIQEEMDRKDDMIDDMLEKLYDKEDKYYAKYAALEKAMSQINSQSQWLTQQLGG